MQLNYIQLAGKCALSVVNLITGGKPVKRERFGIRLIRFFFSLLAGGHQGVNFKRSVRQLVIKFLPELLINKKLSQINRRKSVLLETD